MIGFDVMTALVNSRLEYLLPGIRIAWKNIAFTPSQTETWVKAMFVPTSDYPVTLGEEGQNELVGFFQVQINSPINTGVASENAIMDTVRKGLPVGYHFTVPKDNKFWITGRDYSAGGQTSLNDFSKGGTEESWNVQYLTFYWSVREPRN